MKEDFQKFLELVKTDEALQKKLEEAGKNYDGEQTEEAAFHAVLEPIAKEAGFSITLDDCQQSVRELAPDEMNQVAGGTGYGPGYGAAGCFIIGLGIGGGRTPDSGFACGVIGFGFGAQTCWEKGVGEGKRDWDVKTDNNGQ